MPSSRPPCCSPATAPPSGRRGRVGADPHKVGVLVRGRAEQRRLAITSQRIPAPGAADTGGTPSGTTPRRCPAHRDRKIAAPRAAALNSGSPRERRNISVPRPPRPRRAAPPPRRVGTHIPDMRAAPPPPPHPLLSYAGRAQAVRRREKKRTSPVIVNTLARKRKRWSRPAARARATRRPRARSAAAASRPTRSRPTRPSARPGPSGRTSLLKSRRPRRRTPTRPSLGGDAGERIEQGCR